MLLKIHPDNPSDRLIDKVAEVLEKGGIIVYPMDTVYGIGCDIFNTKAVEKIAKIKQVDPQKHNFSFICRDFSHLSTFTKNVETEIYKLMRRNLPGPFTFILHANNKVPNIFLSKKKTVGIRIPNNNIAREIVRCLGRPILTTSLPADEETIEYTTIPELIYEKYEKLVDLVIDAGEGGIEPSTIVDCTGGEIEILRQSKYELDY